MRFSAGSGERCSPLLVVFPKQNCAVNIALLRALAATAEQNNDGASFAGGKVARVTRVKGDKGHDKGQV